MTNRKISKYLGLAVGLACFGAVFAVAQESATTKADFSSIDSVGFKKAVLAKGTQLTRDGEYGEFIYEVSLGADDNGTRSSNDPPKTTCLAEFKLPVKLEAKVQNNAVIAPPGGLQSKSMKDYRGEVLVPSGRLRATVSENKFKRVTIQPDENSKVVSKSGLRLKQIVCYKWNFSSNELPITLQDIEGALGVSVTKKRVQAAKPGATSSFMAPSDSTSAPSSREAN